MRFGSSTSNSPNGKIELPDNIDLYEILGLSRVNRPDSDVIKKAYNRLVLKNHPDRGGNEAEFILLNRAYTVLSDKILRKEYDDIIRSGFRSSSTPNFKHPKSQQDQNSNTESKDPFSAFTSTFNSSKMQEELKWISDIISSSYYIFQQFQANSQAREKEKHNRFFPVLPVPTVSESPNVRTNPRSITDEDFDNMLRQLVSKPTTMGEGKNKEQSTVQSTEQINDQVRDLAKDPQKELEDPLLLEVSGTIRQYLLGRKKKIKVILSGSDIPRIITVPIQPGSQIIESGAAKLHVKVNILNESNESGIWSIPNWYAKDFPDNRQEKKIYLIFRSYYPLVPDLKITSFSGLQDYQIADIKDISCINCYYTCFENINFIIYSSHNSSIDEINTSSCINKEKLNKEEQKTEHITSIPYPLTLSPFNSIEELFNYYEFYIS